MTNYTCSTQNALKLKLTIKIKIAMNYKNKLAFIIILLASSFLIGCDIPENPLRAKARATEQQAEQPGREQETKHGSAISDSFKKDDN